MTELPSLNPVASARKSVAVTPSDSTDIASVVRGLYVGTTGNVVVVNLDDTTCTFTSVPSGTILPVQCKRVNSTSTTASSIVALL
jgi:hypothetical protein